MLEILLKLNVLAILCHSRTILANVLVGFHDIRCNLLEKRASTKEDF